MRLSPASLAAALWTVREQIRMSSSLPVAAVCQMTATPDKEANFSACTRLVEQAKEGGASMVFLPEGFDYIGSSREETLALSESLDGDIITRYTHLARKLDLWLSLGGFHERGHDWKTDRRIYNSHVIINGKGEVVSVYRKAHLFDVELTSKGVSLKESAFTVAGPRLLPPVQTPIGKVGLGVCYDLRFPELSSALQRHGAEILTFPSAFTVATGAAHWEVLHQIRHSHTTDLIQSSAMTGAPAGEGDRDAVFRAGGGSGRVASLAAGVLRTRSRGGPVGGGDRGLRGDRCGRRAGADRPADATGRQEGHASAAAPQREGLLLQLGLKHPLMNNTLSCIVMMIHDLLINWTQVGLMI
ncbi:deaminated glutathione amidase isoform X1 [Pimephales promelas]|uniref:deaminated glutathione amidase isoform X1 n=1 Tax=Pimephales promelas TaxID=90988 RepID=UPI001955751A|nr:deaminated glutathione amidase isoform X1 [Pimephales promelas]